MQETRRRRDSKSQLVFSLAIPGKVGLPTNHDMLDLRLLGFVWKVFFKTTGKKKPFLRIIFENKSLFENLKYF